MKKMLLMLTIAGISAIFNRASAQENSSTYYIGDRGSVTVKHLPDGISAKGINWPSWVKTREDTINFLARAIVTQQGQISALQSKLSKKGPITKAIDSLKKGQTDLSSRITDNEKKTSLQLEIIKQKQKYDSLILVGNVSDVITAMLDSVHDVRTDMKYLSDSTNGRIDCVAEFIKTHAKLKTEARVKREHIQDAVRSNADRRTGGGSSDKNCKCKGCTTSNTTYKGSHLIPTTDGDGGIDKNSYDYIYHEEYRRLLDSIKQANNAPVRQTNTCANMFPPNGGAPKKTILGIPYTSGGLIRDAIITGIGTTLYLVVKSAAANNALAMNGGPGGQHTQH